MPKPVFAALSSLVCLCQCTWAANDPAASWPRWRGPEATGVAPEADPPLSWSEEQNIQWKVALPGEGSGSPIVWDDRIYLLAAIKTDRTAEGDDPAARRNDESRFQLVQNQTRRRNQAGAGVGRRGLGTRGFGRADKPTNFYKFNVLCVNRRTGMIIWQKTAAEVVPHEGHHATGSFASSSPVTDGRNLYVSFGSRGVFSYDLDGNLRWQYKMPQLSTRHGFGEGSSPALFGDTLVVNADHEGQSFIVALDAETGDERWKKLRDEATTWVTPLIVEHNGVVHVIVNGMNRARAYNLETGDVLWECGGQASNPIATAVVHDGVAICMTGHRGAALYAVPLDARGDVTDSDQIAWSRNRDTPYVPSPLLYDGLLYFTKSNNAVLTCVDAATGEVKYGPQRLAGMDSIYASPVAADGRIYFTGREGATVVVKHGPEFQVLAENQLDETLDATPAVVGNQIILRGDKHLYCIAEQ